MSGAETLPTYVFEGFALDAQHRALLRAGEAIPLAPKVFDTLLYLVERPGQLLDKQRLLNEIWPHVVVEENSLTQTISQLRRVLGERPEQHRFIVTEPGRGYRFVATVTTLPGPLAYATGTEHSVEDNQTAARVKAARERMPLPNSVAVLPFTNLSANPDVAFFAAGLHVEILRQLTKVSALNVIALPSVLRYADTENSVPEIAAELRVHTVLFADVRYANGAVRVTPRLVDGATGEILWSDGFDRHFEDVFALESDIAAAVANALSAELSPAEQASIAKAQTDSPEAYGAYLRARAMYRTPSSRLILYYLDEALQHDPEFAEAYALKATFYAGSLISQFGYAATASEADKLVCLARESAQKALMLDEHNWVARNALAEMHLYSWRWTGALEEYKLAAHAVPKIPRTPIYALFTATKPNEFEHAIREQRRVIALNPNDSSQHWILGVLHAYSGDARAAASATRKAIDLEPGYGLWHVWLAHTEGMAGNTAAALVELKRAEELPLVHDSPLSIAMQAYAYARNGRPDDAARLVKLLETRAPDRRFEAGNWALAHLAVGDVERARQGLETVVDKIAHEEPDSGFYALRLIRLNLYSDPVLNQQPFADLRAQLRGR